MYLAFIVMDDAVSIDKLVDNAVVAVVAIVSSQF